MSGGREPPDHLRSRVDLVEALGRLRREAARGRGKTHVSLFDLAKATGIPKSSLGNYLSGKTLVPADQLDLILQALGVEAGALARWAQAWDRVADSETVPRPGSGERAPAGAAAGPALVGRAAEMRTLRGFLSELGTRRGRVALVEGPPGIGKSSLVGAAMGEAQAAGIRVVWASCDELSREFPLVPLREAVGPQAHGDDHGSLLVPHSGTDKVSMLAERLVAAVHDLCAEPLLLVVDDLQWADQATVAAIGRLARMCRHRPLLLVGTMRPVPRRPELSALRRSVGPEAIVRLGSLSASETTELMTRVLRAAPGPRLVTLAEKASGNPLYLTELLASLSRADGLTTAGGRVDARVRHVPESLSAVILDRIGFLSPKARELLRTAALLGSEFRIPQLAAVTGQPSGALVPRVEEAIANDVLRDDGGVLAFRHPLIRDALYGQMSPAVRAVRHGEVARGLAAAGASPEEVARQLLPAVDRTGGGIDPWIVRWLVDDGQPVVDHAPAVAVPLLSRAVDGLPPGSAAHDVLSSRLAEALYRVGDARRAEDLVRKVLPGVGDLDALVSFYYTLHQCVALDGRLPEMFEALESTMRSPALDARHRARLLALAARSHRSLGQLDRAVRTAQQAAADAREAADVWAEGWALGTLALARGMSGEPAAALPLLDQALAVTRRHPALADLRLLLQVNQASALGDLGRHDRALRAGRLALELAIDTGSTVRRAQAHAVLAELLFELGRWDEALRETAAAAVLGEDPAVRSCVGGISAAVGLHRDDPAAAGHLEVAERYAARMAGRMLGPLWLARSLSRERLGRPADALEVLTGGIFGVQETEETLDLLPDAVRLALLCRDDSTASALLNRAAELAAGSEARYRHAIAAHCRGLRDGDAAQLTRAAELYAEAGRQLLRAQALEAAADAHAATGRSHDARSALRASRPIYERLGAAWDLSRVDGKLS